MTSLFRAHLRNLTARFIHICIYIYITCTNWNANKMYPDTAPPSFSAHKVCENEITVMQYFESPLLSIYRHKFRWTNAGAISGSDCVFVRMHIFILSQLNVSQSWLVFRHFRFVPFALARAVWTDLFICLSMDFLSQWMTEDSGKRLQSLSQRPDRPYDPPRFQSKGNQGVFSRG